VALDGLSFSLPKKKNGQNLAEKIGNLPLGKADARGFSRLMLSGAMEVEIDTLGRILVPDYLKEYAGLEKKVVIAGLYNHIEVWGEERWGDYKSKAEGGGWKYR